MVPDVEDVPEEVESDEQVLDVDPDQEVMPVSYDITSYGADYPVDGLVKRLSNQDIVVPSFDPMFNESDEVQGFQRRFVWSRPQMDKFVESLLLACPCRESSLSETGRTSYLFSTVSSGFVRCRPSTRGFTPGGSMP